VQLNGKVARGTAKGANGAAKPQTHKRQGRTTANAALLRAAKPPTRERQCRNLAHVRQSREPTPVRQCRSIHCCIMIKGGLLGRSNRNCAVCLLEQTRVTLSNITAVATATG
jgi:hypothetical protein